MIIIIPGGSVYILQIEIFFPRIINYVGPIQTTLPRLSRYYATLDQRMIYCL